MTQTFWNAHIDGLNLSTRSHNGLMRIGAITIGEVCKLIMSENGREGVRNLGRKSLEEVVAKLQSLGFALASDDE